MEKEMNRAERRHHTDRLKHNRRFYHGSDLSRDPVQLGRTVTTPATCSCAGCGNPRKFNGERTVQELREMQRGAHA
jgi:hypothetical protein